MFQVSNTEYKSSVNCGTVVFQELLVNQNCLIKLENHKSLLHYFVVL